MLQAANALLRLFDGLCAKKPKRAKAPEPSQPPLLVLKFLSGIYAVTISTHRCSHYLLAANSESVFVDVRKGGRGGGLSPRRLRIVGTNGNHPADLLIGRLILVMDKRRVVSVLSEQFFVIGA